MRWHNGSWITLGLAIAVVGSPRTHLSDACRVLADSVVNSPEHQNSAIARWSRQILRQCTNDFPTLLRAGSTIAVLVGSSQSASDLATRELANRMLQRAVQLQPRSAAAWFAYGQLLGKTDRGQEAACRALRRGLALADSFPDAASAELLSAIMMRKAHALQIRVDRVRWVGDQRPPTPDQARLLDWYRAAMRSPEVASAAAMAYLRELTLEGNWEDVAVTAESLSRAANPSSFYLAIAGMAAYHARAVSRADSLFEVAVVGLPDSLRTKFDLLPRELQTVTDFWRRARPSWLLPVNELLVEYRSRAAYATLVFGDEYGLSGWPRDLMADVLMRYGIPLSIAREGAQQDGSSVDGIVDVDLACPQCGCGRRVADPGPRVDSIVWSLGDRSPVVFKREPEHRPANPLSERLLGPGPATRAFERDPMTFRSLITPLRYQLPVQIARFRGVAESNAVVMYGLVPAAVMGIPEDDSLDVGLFVFSDRSGFPMVIERRGQFQAGQALASTFQASLEAGSYHYSVEALDSLRGVSGTARDSLVAPRWKPDSLALSDMVIALSVTPRLPTAPLTWRDLAIDASRTLSVTQGTPLWVVWEVYGLRADTARVVRHETRLTLRDGSGRSLPVRLLQGLGLRRSTRAPDMTLQWSAEVLAAPDGRALEYVSVTLPEDAVGDYELMLTVIDSAGRQAESRRRFTVIRP